MPRTVMNVGVQISRLIKWFGQAIWSYVLFLNYRKRGMFVRTGVSGGVDPVTSIDPLDQVANKPS